MRACWSDRGGLVWQCVHPGNGHKGHWEGSACVRVVVLHPAMIRVDGGGGLRWPVLIVEAAYAGARADGGGGICACGYRLHPCQFWVDLIGTGVGRRDVIIFMLHIATILHSGPIATMLHNSGRPNPPIATVRPL
jgi:hypothetical protein